MCVCVCVCVFVFVFVRASVCVSVCRIVSFYLSTEQHYVTLYPAVRRFFKTNTLNVLYELHLVTQAAPFCLAASAVHLTSVQCS